VRQSTTLIGAMLLHRGDGDAMFVWHFGRHKDHLRHVAKSSGLERGASIFAAMNVLLLPKRTLFICDTYVNEDPTAEQNRGDDGDGGRRGTPVRSDPKVALLSHSNFGTDDSPSALKMTAR